MGIRINFKSIIFTILAFSFIQHSYGGGGKLHDRILINVCADTQDKRFFQQHPWQDRIVILDNILRTLVKTSEYSKTPSALFRAMLVAPEYFFAKDYPEGYFTPDFRNHGRHYSYEEFVRINNSLIELSRRYPDVLIVPGTIAWKERVVQPESMGNPVESAFGAPVPCWSSFEEWYKHGRIAPDGKMLKYREILNMPGNDFIGGGGITLKEKLGMIAEIMHTNPNVYIEQLCNAKLDFAWNSAPFYLGGDVLGVYSKHSDFQEVLCHEELSVAMPSVGNSILNIGDVTIGVEICLDHPCRVLRKFIEKNSGMLNPRTEHLRQRPDIHLVLSARVKSEYNCSKRYGYFIHSSSDCESSEFTFKDSDGRRWCIPGRPCKYIEIPIFLYRFQVPGVSSSI